MLFFTCFSSGRLYRFPVVVIKMFSKKCDHNKRPTTVLKKKKLFRVVRRELPIEIPIDEIRGLLNTIL